MVGSHSLTTDSSDPSHCFPPARPHPWRVPLSYIHAGNALFVFCLSVILSPRLSAMPCVLARMRMCPITRPSWMFVRK